MAGTGMGRVRDRLLGVYERFVGEPPALGVVYLGFVTFFGGIALGAIGVLIYLWSNTYPPSAPLFWPLRETAVVLAATGLPVFLVSFVVLLPSNRRALYLAGIGLFATLVAIAVFVTAYPYDWNVPGEDYSSTGILIYAGGLVVLAGTSGAALVTNYIQQTRPDTPEDGESGAGETVTDEQVERDIEDALASTELSWGGVERTDTPRLEFTTEEADIDRTGFDNVDVVETRAEGVDEAVQGLQGLRGNTDRETAGEGADEQVAALRELRNRQQAEEEPDRGLLTRIIQFITR